MGAVTSAHNLVASNHTNLLSNSSGHRRYKLGPTGLKSRCQQGRIPSGDSERQSAPGPFPDCTHHLRSLSCAPSSVFKAGNSITPAFASVLTSSLSVPTPTFSYKDSCNYMAPTWITWDHLPISRSLTQPSLQSPSCHVRFHIHRFWGVGHGIFGGPLICPPYSIKKPPQCPIASRSTFLGRATGLT